MVILVNYLKLVVVFSNNKLYILPIKPIIMIEYVLLGIIQGIFEWIPISSEGVISLTSQLLIKGTNPVDIAIFLHLGTLLAVMVYFWKDWLAVLTLKNKPLFRFLFISTIISLLVGYPVYSIIKDTTIGAALLLVTGVGLLFTSYFHRKKMYSKVSKTNLAIITGCLQGLSVIPGLSRSGSTIFGLSLGDLSPSEVLKYSYMMSAPVVLASAAFVYIQNPSLINGWPSLISGFVIGLLSLSFITRISKKINFSVFALVFAILCLIGAGIGFLL